MKSASKSRDRDETLPPGQTTSDRRTAVEGKSAWTTHTPGRLLLLAGWILPQLLLLGPALLGRTVNLPVDLLATPHLYLPATPEYQHVVPYHALHLLDLLLGFQDSREFTTKEIRAGRLPLWQPSNFAGAPFANWPKYSPFELPNYIFPGPTALAWISLLQAITCGLGMWLFLRHGLCLSYWPSAVAAWCVPLAGFMSTWQGYSLRAAACWLPWQLFLVRCSTRRPWGWSSVALAVVTTLLILSGGSDIGGLVLITAGLYAVWLLAWEGSRRHEWRCAASTGLSLGLGWLLAFLMAAPYIWPMFEYNRTGARVAARTGGSEERPPVGAAALPPVVLPDVYGTDEIKSLPVGSENVVESSSGACAGLLTFFWLVPLAWFRRELRRDTIFFYFLAVAGLSWALGLPGFVDVFRIKPLNMFSYNRWVFATAVALLALAAIGMESLRAPLSKTHLGFAIPMLLTAAFGMWCFFRAFELPEPYYAELESAIRHGRAGHLTLEQLRVAQRTLSFCYALGAALSVAAEFGWLVTIWRSRRLNWCRWVLIGLVPAQLLWFAWQERRQADRSLYFPRVAALQKLAALPPGRIWGVDCLPPNLGQFHKREDIRGYDGVDPSSFIRLFELACEAQSPRSPYAVTQEALPALLSTGRRVKLHPVADLLNVRYLVLRTAPPVDFPVVVHQDDYWVLENRDALPRAFVPRSVKVVKSDEEALAIMRSPGFEPRETVLTSTDPHVGNVTQGTAQIRYETPSKASLDVDLQNDGVVVISDLWDPGWRAELDGGLCPIHRVDTALRGLRVPSGKHRIELTYDPPSVRLGFWIAGAGGLMVILWSATLLMMGYRVNVKG